MTSILCYEHQGTKGDIIGEICLNSAKSLNALTLEMVRLLRPQLEQWQMDERVKAIVIGGAGEKAFCAGGDISRLYDAMKTPDHKDFARTFFTEEYQLDHLIHHYEKPIIAWGQGIVMGGGMGIFNACRYRVVTPSSHLAMPEVSIGLYPDVAASWFLNRVPQGIGLFLGLTGCAINAQDAVFLGLADHLIDPQYRTQLVPQLQAADWSGSADAVVNHVLAGFERPSQPLFEGVCGPLQQYQATILTQLDRPQLRDIIAAIMTCDIDDVWWQKVRATLNYASPLALHLTYEQLKRSQSLTLSQVFEQELSLSIQCSRFGEFQEGIRALLIDKDRQPKWRFASVADVDAATVAALMAPVEKASQFEIRGTEYANN